MFNYFVALTCVLGLVAGQILFKVSARGLHETGTIFSWVPGSALFAAMMLYGVTSIAWVWVLQKLDLGKVYPIMALAFILVPLASYLMFGERFGPQYIVGVCLISAGIGIAVSA